MLKGQPEEISTKRPANMMVYFTGLMKYFHKANGICLKISRRRLRYLGTRCQSSVRLVPSKI